MKSELGDKEAALEVAADARSRTFPTRARRSGPTRASTPSSARRASRPKFDFEPLDHVALIEKNDWADLSRIVQVSGSRTYCLKGRLALLETKLMAWALEQDRRAQASRRSPSRRSRASRRSSTRASSPATRKRPIELPNDDLWLAGTAEVALTSLHSGEIIEADKLPILYAGYSPCFRREAGSAGKDVRGLLRVHQFVKVEQYVICEADDAQSADWHARLLGLAEELLQALEIPYQVIETSTGDMGLGKYPHERYRELGAEPGQISRDPQLLDAARLAGAAREPSLPRRRREGPLRAHAQQHGAGVARASWCRCSRTIRPRTGA